MNLKYLITTKEDFDLVLDYINYEDMFGIDTETNGKWSRFELSLVGISIGFDLFSVYIPLTHIEGEQLPLPYVIEKLKPILEDPQAKYVFHNAKFDEKVFRVYGIRCAGSGDDTYVLSWLLDEEGKHGLKGLTKRYLGITMETYEDVISRGPKRRGVDRDYNFAKVSLRNALSYAADDAYYTLRLYRIFAAAVRKEALWDAYVRIERPLVRVVGDMEWRGILVDKDYLEYANKSYPDIMQEIEAEVYEEVGEAFNIDSGPQLGKMLFEKLGIGKNVPKTKSGQYSTDKKTLETYAGKHEIVDKILRRKKVKKTYDVFVKGLYPHIDTDGRIHPAFNGQGTTTGRFSSSGPNVQQIQGDEVEQIKVRDLFIPSPGYVFVAGDFGQIELRVMANNARDEVAIAAFKSGKNFHSETAREMFDLAMDEEPTARQRFYAKGLNFGVPYGRGPTSVAEVLGLNKVSCYGNGCDECGQCFINRWFAAFPNVGPYRDWLIKKTRKLGYVRTLAGRKRRLPNIASPDSKLRYGAERQAFNTVCQGSAADIIKLAMVQVAPKLERLGAFILIQIHDELITEAPIENAEEVRKIMQETMENPLDGKNPLILPLDFEPKIVERWSQAK